MASNRYPNLQRSILLLRERDQAFGVALAQFIEELGLQVQSVDYTSDASSVDAAARQLDIGRARNTAVVTAMESSVVSNMAGNGGGRYAQPAAAAVYLTSMAQVTFGRQKSVVVTQSDDPLSTDLLPFHTHRIQNNAETIQSFIRTLLDAECMLSAEAVGTSSTALNLRFPQDWWTWEFQDPGDVAPSFTEFLVDAAFNRSLTQLRLHQDIIAKIKARSPLDLKFHYIGWRAAQAWSRLTSDPQYGHIEHINQLGRWIPEIVRHIDQTKRYNYISLGPGDGKTDVHLFPPFKRSLNFHTILLVDVSIELLQLATDALIEDVIVPQQSRDHPRIRAMLGDFEDSLNKLAPVLNISGVQNLFLLLGFTIGNGNEMSVLENLSAGMRSADYLLFDARLHPHGANVTELSEEEMTDLQYPYDTHTLKAFAFGPVEEACDYVVRESDSIVRFHLVPQARGTGFNSSIRGAVNVHVECSGIYESEAFCNKLGIRRPRQLLKQASAERLRLASITFYDFDQLTAALQSSSVLDVVWAKRSQNSAAFLLQRTETSL